MVLRAVAVGAACILPLLAGCTKSAIVVPPVVINVEPVAGRGFAPGVEELTHGDVWSSKEAVEVQWRGSWWPAIVLEKRGDRWLVHYEGYSSEWDEVVSLERIRERQAKADVDDHHEIDPDPDP
jgi:hypothetical protein